MQPFRIDVHHHAVPDIHLEAMDRQGYVPSRGAGSPACPPQSSLDLMEPTQILFGSDFPYAPESLVGVEVQQVKSHRLSLHRRVPAPRRLAMKLLRKLIDRQVRCDN